jgi:hypothetical protein
MVQCAVVGCRNNTRVIKEVIYHRFPIKNPQLLASWNKCCGDVNPNDLSGAKWKRICSSHFTDEDYVEGGGQRRLSPRAVPSLLVVSGIFFYAK